MPCFPEKHEASFKLSSGVEKSTSLLLHPTSEDGVECLCDQPNYGEAELVFNVDVEKDYLLGDNPREVTVQDTEKPVAYIRVVVASKQGMWERTYLLGLAEVTIGTVYVSQYPVKSLLGWEDVMDHFPKKSVVSGLKTR